MANQLLLTLLAGASLFLSAAAHAQEPRPLQGLVLDPAQSSIAGALVTASEPNTNSAVAVASAVSDAHGRFLLQAAPGSYTLSVSKDGFVKSSRLVTIPQGEPLEIVLDIAPSKQTLTVVESAGYLTGATASATRTLTPLLDTPQSVSVVSQEQIRDQMMMNIGDVVRYIPGITAHQGENNRDQLVIRGNSTSADFFVNGVRDDVQYYRDLYNLERVEALKGPNALIFGRGGAGGVINRVTKEAGFTSLREITLTGGSFGDQRLTADLNQPLNSKAAVRLNGMFEDSNSFRNFVALQRYGINPTLTLLPGANTKITVSYENFHDTRVADRGVPSFQGSPVDVPIATYYGDPKQSNVHALVNLGSVAVEHQLGRLTIRNRTMFGAYNRGYQNFVPGTVSADKSQVVLSAYNNATVRLNMFNQTDFNYLASTGAVRHTLLFGIEVGRQLTGNFRNTGYFNNTAASISVPGSDPVINTPMTWRQSATDADNHLRTNLGAAYLQDQIELTRYWQVIAGVRFDHFDLRYHDNRSGNNLRRIDNLISPRAGVVFKPVNPVSLYASYSVSYLPSSGDQFSSLTSITQQVKPEKFNNYEVGVKWSVVPSLSLTAAAYRLDRTNTRSTDPNDPGRIVQTGGTRNNGFEIGTSGSLTTKWKVAGGYALQNSFISRDTASARAGAQVALVPHHSFSLWNHYQFHRRLSAGFGLVNRSDMFASIDDTVRLRGYTRADAAVFVPLAERLRLQVNVENLLDRRYYLNADSNTNISPGSPRAVRVGLIARF